MYLRWSHAALCSPPAWAVSLRTDGERSTRQSCGWSTVDTESQDLRQPSMFKQCRVGACAAETIYSQFLFTFKGEFLFMYFYLCLWTVGLGG